MTVEEGLRMGMDGVWLGVIVSDAESSVVTAVGWGVMGDWAPSEPEVGERREAGLVTELD